MNLKTMAAQVALASVIVSGVMATVQSPAQALSISFKPTGTSVDGDTAKDIVTSVGSILNVDIFLETFGVAEDDKITKLGFDIGFDNTELGFSSFTKTGIFSGLSVTGPTAGALLPGETNQILRIALTGGSVNPDQAGLKLGTAKFLVLSGLANNGKNDLATRFLNVFDDDNEPLINLASGQIQRAEVQPIPTPALLPGIAVMGATILRCRKRWAGAV